MVRASLFVSSSFSSQDTVRLHISKLHRSNIVHKVKYPSAHPSADLTEDSDTSNTLDQCIDVLSASPYAPLPINSQCLRSIGALQFMVQTSTLTSPTHDTTYTVQEAWKPVFWAEVLTVVRALRAEKDLHGRNFSLNDWMQLRILTISGPSSNTKSIPYNLLTYLPYHSSAPPRLSPRLPRPYPFPLTALAPTRNFNPDNLSHPHPHPLPPPRPARIPHSSHPRLAKRPPRLAQRPPGAQSAECHRSADSGGLDSACGLRRDFAYA